MHRTVQAFRDRVSAVAASAVAVGAPSDPAADTAGVLVWPWRLEEDAAHRNARAFLDDGIEAPSATVHCLVFARNLELLDRIRKDLHDIPVIRLEDATVRIQAELLPSETLLTLFMAAKVTPRICLAYILRSAAV